MVINAYYPAYYGFSFNVHLCKKLNVKITIHTAVAAEEWCRVKSSSTSKYKRYINILLLFIIIIIVRRQIVSSLCLSCHTLFLFHFLIDLPKIFERFCGTYTLSYEFFYSLLSLKCLIFVLSVELH